MLSLLPQFCAFLAATGGKAQLEGRQTRRRYIELAAARHPLSTGSTRIRMHVPSLNPHHIASLLRLLAAQWTALYAIDRIGLPAALLLAIALAFAAGVADFRMLSPHCCFVDAAGGAA